jgi:hypothetical protein
MCSTIGRATHPESCWNGAHRRHGQGIARHRERRIFQNRSRSTQERSDLIQTRDSRPGAPKRLSIQPVDQHRPSPCSIRSFDVLLLVPDVRQAAYRHTEFGGQANEPGGRGLSAADVDRREQHRDEPVDAGGRQIGLHSRSIHAVGNIRQDPNTYAKILELQKRGDRIGVGSHPTSKAAEESIGDHLAIARWKSQGVGDLGEYLALRNFSDTRRESRVVELEDRDCPPDFGLSESVAASGRGSSDGIPVAWRPTLWHALVAEERFAEIEPDRNRDAAPPRSDMG